MNTQATIPNGWYGIFPEGACWVAVRIYDGKLAFVVEEATAATHEAARDRYWWVGDAMADERPELPAAMAAAVVRACRGVVAGSPAVVALADDTI